MSNRLILPGDLVNEYNFGFEDLRSLDEIGSGRFGTVYKMIHIPTEYPMAVKRVRLVCMTCFKCFKLSIDITRHTYISYRMFL